MVIAWHDVAYWWLDVPATESGKRKSGAGRVALQVQPAPHVTQPGAGPWRTIWARRWQRRVVCEPDLTDGSADEIAAAMRHFAGRLEARAATPTPAAPAPTQPGGPHATIGPSPALRHKAGMSLVGFLLVLAIPLGVVGALTYGRIKYGYDGPPPPAGGGIDWYLVAVGGLFGSVVLVALGGAAAEAAFIWYHHLGRATVTVTSAGLLLRSRWRDVTLP